jgi:hypothetical protein
VSAWASFTVVARAWWRGIVVGCRLGVGFVGYNVGTGWSRIIVLSLNVVVVVVVG